MYKQSNIAIPINRLGLAKAMGLVIQFLFLFNLFRYIFPFPLLLFLFLISHCFLNYYFCVKVAASHLDTVLEKLKDIIDNVGQTIIQRFMPDLGLSVYTSLSKLVYQLSFLTQAYACKVIRVCLVSHSIFCFLFQFSLFTNYKNVALFLHYFMF